MTMKFNFGDVVVPIELKEVKQFVPCTGCAETGTVILRDGREWECPVCNGAKKIRKVTGKKWMPVRSVFSAASFKVEEIAMLGKIAEGEESYRFGNTYYDAQDCFENEELAKAECDRRNARIQEMGTEAF